MIKLKFKKFVCISTVILTSISYATHFEPSDLDSDALFLNKQSGFFRLSFDSLKMPQDIQSMGLVGLNYFVDLTPQFYIGMGTYGAVTGTQGGLFTLGAGGGWHQEFAPHWWSDAGLHIGGGGGKSSLVGGGLMLRPHLGIEYDWQWVRLGLHYSYINFPSGDIHSSQIGFDIDIPTDFYYVSSQQGRHHLFNLDDIHIPIGKYLDFQRNDFGMLLQAYRQRPGTKAIGGSIQDGTINLVGAELDHYFTEHMFWSLRANGAYDGIPNGYMDILGGIGYHAPLTSQGLALVPQISAGAGGGGAVDTAGGLLFQPQIGLEYPITSNFATRLSGGYLWSAKGELRAFTATGEILYHLDWVTTTDKPATLMSDLFKVQNWRLQLFNQTYVHPQRVSESTTSADNLVVLQLDQIVTPMFYLSYQAASAYSGTHAGGLATGMVGLGVQSATLLNHTLQPFAELFIGAGGGGGLALGGGSIIEPAVGMRYLITPAVGLQCSIGQVKALRDNLNTPVVNFGLTINFGTLSPKN